MFLSEWSEFPSAPCLAGKKNLVTTRVSMLLKSRASLTCFRACFFPGRAKDLSAHRYNVFATNVHTLSWIQKRHKVLYGKKEGLFGYRIQEKYIHLLISLLLHHIRV